MGIHGLVSVGVPASQPVWLLYIKGAILVLSVVILGLAAWSISIFGGYNGVLVYGTGAGGLVIFVVIKTWIVYGGALALEIWAPQYFYRVAAFVLYILSIIFWLSAWAWSASLAGLWLGFNTLGGRLPKEYKDEGSALGACAGLGALVWVLVIVHFVFFTLAAIRDDNHVAAAAGPGQAELGAVKAEGYQQPPYQQQPAAYAAPQQQPYGAPQQQPYGAQQQPYPSQ